MAARMSGTARGDADGRSAADAREERIDGVPFLWRSGGAVEWTRRPSFFLSDGHTLCMPRPSPSLSGGEELLWTGAAVAAPSPTSAVVPGPLPLRRRRDLGRCDRLELACDDAELAYMPKPAELLPFRVGARRWFGCMRRSKCGACANSDERGPRHRRIQRKWEASFFLSSASSTPQRGENWKSLLQGLFQFTSADGVRQLGRHRMKGACS
jgi:hypothetical protein